MDDHTLYVTKNNEVHVFKGNKLDYIYKGHQQRINQIVVLPNNRFASCSDDATVKIWNRKHLNVLHHAGYIKWMLVLPNNRLAIWATHGNATDLFDFRIWNIAGDPYVESNIADMGYQADMFGSTFVYEHGYHSYCRNVLNMNDDTPQEFRGRDIIQLKDQRFATIERNTIVINNVTVYTILPACMIYKIIQLHDGRLASCSSDHIIRLWDLDQPNVPPTILQGHDGPVQDLLQLFNTQLVSCSNSSICIWNLDTFNFVTLRHGYRIISMKELLDGRLAVTMPNSIKIWNVTDMTYQIKRKYSQIYQFRTHDDNKELAKTLYQMESRIVLDVWTIIIDYL